MISGWDFDFGGSKRYGGRLGVSGIVNTLFEQVDRGISIGVFS